MRKLNELRELIREGVDEADRGELAELDVEAIIAAARRTFAQIRLTD